MNAIDATNTYRKFVKPKLAEFLAALKLDISYTRGSGAYLFDKLGTQYLDMVGGFGAALLGHNHPDLQKALIDAVALGIPGQCQASIGGEAAQLATQLNQLLGGATGYYAVYASTGAECVEAALKHAYLAHTDGIKRKFERARSLTADECATLDGMGGHIELPCGISSVQELRASLDAQNRATLEACLSRPIVVAIEGSFHGKTSAALKVTHNEKFRVPFEGLSSIETRFIDPERPTDLRSAVTSGVVHFQYPVISGDKLALRNLSATRVMGFIFEPILGEGGIRPLSEGSMATFADLHRELGIPYIVDEIQSGCGRTGSVFAFKQTPLATIEPEYITLSKALGGGLVKIGVTLVRKDIYEEDFGLLHSSTFAEDGLACRIARATLDLLTRNDGEILGKVAERGNRIKERLQWLQRRHEGTIADIRGKGLMLGLEFAPLTNNSPFLAEASRQGVLPFLIASYVLHHHRIRLMPTLGSALSSEVGRRPSILRLQPPVTIENDDIDRLIDSLDEVLTVIERNNEFCLLAHLWGDQLAESDRRDPIVFPAAPTIAGGASSADLRVGFVLHPPDIQRIVSYFMPSLEAYDWNEGAVAAWWSKASRFFDPVLVHRAHIRSNRRIAAVDLVLIPNLPADMIASTPAGRREVADKVAHAVRIAVSGNDDSPPVIVGLGGYTSIVTGSGQSVPDYGVPITTGNSYTVGLLLESIERASEERGVDLGDSTVAVVGACGNIGLAMAENLAAKAGKLVLVGRPGESGRLRLNYARRACMGEIARIIGRSQAGGASLRLGALASRMRDNLARSPELVSRSRAADEMGIEISTDIECIRDADIVVVATSSANGELIQHHMLKSKAILCCASVPSNVSPNLAALRPDCFVFAGGLAQLPEQSRIDFIGLPTGGLAWACLAETIFLGFDSAKRSVGKGRLRTEDVQQIAGISRRHGFSLGPLRPAAATESEHWRDAAPPRETKSANVPAGAARANRAHSNAKNLEPAA